MMVQTPLQDDTSLSTKNQAHSPQSVQPKAKNSSSSGKYVQEKFMILLTLAFVGGVVLYTILPEGPLRTLGLLSFTGGIVYLLSRVGS